jgi:hypothetical protein
MLYRKEALVKGGMEDLLHALMREIHYIHIFQGHAILEPYGSKFGSSCTWIKCKF